ncbi:MAG TPA: hypothetical protein VFN65_12645 [Solirubrobacteraceae bacterium]|nr:hypothetical protein [Solirubrobacteraceae bacterium]
MIALLILVVGGLVAAGLWSWLAAHAGRHAAGSAGGVSARGAGARSGAPLGWRSARTIIEEREALEAEDLAQMLAAHNAWRRRRGRPERTVEEVEMLVAGQAREMRRRRD